MFSDPIAYFLTFTTYGTWLHGRETGSVDRQHDACETPVLLPDPELERRQYEKMKQPEYRLDENRRAVVLKTILEVAAHRGWYVWAAHVRTNHVHVVINAEGKPEKVMNELMAWCSRCLRESLSEPQYRERWTRHGSTRYIWNEEVLCEKIKYVLDEQGERMAWFRGESGSDEGNPEAESVNSGSQNEPIRSRRSSNRHIDCKAEPCREATGVPRGTMLPALTLSALKSFEMIDDAMADVLRQKTEVERLRIAGRLWKSARVIVRGAIRTEHPDWDEEEVNREIARRMSHGVVHP